MEITMIVNPSSGYQDSQKDIDYIYNKLSQHHTVSIHFTRKQYGAKFFTRDAIKADKDLIIVSGGDGTLNEVVAAMGKDEKAIPIAIYPAGTANDFSTYLNISRNPDEFLAMIEDFNILDVDLGRLNETYFINVAAIGELAGLAGEVEDQSKASLGKLAYYLEALSKLPDILRPGPRLQIETEDICFSVDSLLMIIANSAIVGGFKNLNPEARIDDGYFEVLIIKDSNLADIADLYFKILTGKHLGDNSLIYLKAKKLYISSENDDLMINIDGENIGNMPISFEVIEKRLKFLSRKEY